MTRRAEYRLQGLGSREENRQSVQGFNATEEVVRAVCESLSLCHPGLVSGSGFDLIQGRLSLKHGEIRFLILIF